MLINLYWLLCCIIFLSIRFDFVEIYEGEGELRIGHVVALLHLTATDSEAYYAVVHMMVPEVSDKDIEGRNMKGSTVPCAHRQSAPIYFRRYKYTALQESQR
jgi:hypothetical protein